MYPYEIKGVKEKVANDYRRYTSNQNRPIAECGSGAAENMYFR